MITAYFDDSGTHDSSEIVVVAGIFGTEGRIRGLDSNWEAELKRPLEGMKPSLKRFHMFECQDGSGEFARWTRTESDYLVHRLQTHIINSGVSAYGIAISRAAWDGIIRGRLADILGDPEGHCVRNCFTVAATWAADNCFDPDMRFVFDSRPRKTARDAAVVFDAFQRHWARPSLAGLSFASSESTRPLQAADMLAWEFFNHAHNKRRDPTSPLQRPQFARLLSGISFRADFLEEGKIKRLKDEVWDKLDNDVFTAMSDHFRTYNPAGVA